MPRKFTPHGVVRAWFDKALNTNTDRCLIWPFSTRGPKHKPSAQMRRDSKYLNVTRFVCTLAHGRPPSKRHEAAHKCGKHLCVNRRHLYWATPERNAADKKEHGTHTYGERMHNSKLTELQVRYILASRVSSTVLAAMFGVAPTTIRSARSKSWSYLR